MLAVAQANMGALSCYEYVDLPRRAVGADESDYRGEQYLLGPGSIHLTRWTPNVLGYDVDVGGGTIMVVNQNHDDSWQVVEGHGEVISQQGLLAVRLPPGRQHLTLAYRSRAFVEGLAITAVTSLAALLLWLRERRRE